MKDENSSSDWAYIYGQVIDKINKIHSREGNMKYLRGGGDHYYVKFVYQFFKDQWMVSVRIIAVSVPEQRLYGSLIRRWWKFALGLTLVHSCQIPLLLKCWLGLTRDTETKQGISRYQPLGNQLCSLFYKRPNRTPSWFITFLLLFLIREGRIF